MDQNTKPEDEQLAYTKTQRIILSALRMTAWLASLIAVMHITQA